MLVFIAVKPDDFGDIRAFTCWTQVGIHRAEGEELEFALAAHEAVGVGVQ